MAETLDWIIDSIEQTADWRLRKTSEYPDDSRNAEAVEKLGKLAEEVGKMRGSLAHARLEACKISESDNLTLSGWLSEELRQEGFNATHSAHSLVWDIVIQFCDRRKQA